MKIIKRFFCLSFFSLCSVFFCGAADTSVKWTLAAEKFSFTQRNMTSSSNEATSKLMPSLILEQFAENLTRMPRSQEKLDRALYDFQKERTALFLQLSKEVQTRDALVLGNYSQAQLNRKLKEADKKIKEIQDKIEANLKSVQDEKIKREEQIKKDEERRKKMEEGFVVSDTDDDENFFQSFIKNFVVTDDYEQPVVENVVFYKNDINQLFAPSSDVKNAGYQSYEYSKACTDAGIRGLLTGQITIYGSYISVNVSVYQYPGGRLIGSASDVGSKDELREIAINIAGQITPKISDSMPVHLNISVTPEKALENLVITVDDVVYSNKPESLTVSSGVHFIQFASKGFDTESTSFSFIGNREFNISVDMKEKQTGTVKLAFTKPVEGDVFANGIFRDKMDKEKLFSSIQINNRPILGHFVSVDGYPSDFLIQQSLLKEDAILSVKPFSLDKSAYIDTRRIWMYRSYSALIVSLIPTFYVLGNYNNGVTGFFSNLSAEQEKRILEVCNGITSGISIACAAWFVYELVRYLNAANSVLPVEAKKIDEKTLKKIEARKIKTHPDDIIESEDKDNNTNEEKKEE